MRGGGGDKNIEKEALCSKCIVFILHENTTTGGPASFMQQVMHYIFTCLELAKLDKYKMQSSTNTKCESRQMKNLNLNKYKMQQVMHYIYSPAWSWRSSTNTKSLCNEYPTKCWGDSSVPSAFLYSSIACMIIFCYG